MKTICSKCCEAGEYNKNGNKMDNSELKELAHDAARELHGECEQPESCLCQHRVGVYVE